VQEKAGGVRDSMDTRQKVSSGEALENKLRLE
jgi:hypothetical protein